MNNSHPIGDFMCANIERALRNEPLLDIEQCEAFAEYESHFEAATRAVAERDRVARDEARSQRSTELKDGCFPQRAIAAAMSPTETASLRLAREYLAGRKPGLVFAGSVGCGKTTAAVWVALQTGGSAPGFLRASVLEAKGRYDKRTREWLEARTMLVLDDVGSEVVDQAGNFRSLLEETVDSFYGDGKRIVITTNMQKPLFVERYGARTASRIAESAMWANCGSIDLRRQQTKLGAPL